MTAPVERLFLKRGSDWGFTRAITNADGSPTDLTGATLRMHVRDRDGALAIEATTANGMLSHDDDGGVVTVDIPYTETDDLVVEEHKTDIEMTFLSGSRKYSETITIMVLQNETRD